MPIPLVTSAEMNASNNSLATLTAKFAPNKEAPRIDVKAPKLNTPIASPIAIRINFEATSPATVRPESFKVLYGAFQIDITSRLTSIASATVDGIVVPEASLPVGKHKLLLSIEDSMGRKGYRSVEFEVQ